MSETSDSIPVNTVTSRDRIVAGWLFVVAAMVLMMVVLGGVTRLTHSGLSMVDWRPVTGWLPPMGESAWMEAFEKYKAFPQYQKLNMGMSLEEFQAIYWPEFLHRVWGRIIGLAFFIPFVFFILRGWVKGLLAKRLFVLFVLGGLQGGMGWFMVKSGMVDQPDVSQYRLTAHLGLAIILYGYLIWTALGVLGRGLERAYADLKPVKRSRGLMVLIFVTILSGGFVAGLDAGFIYNTFPLMDGALIPEGLLEVTPLYLNPFENIITVQFDHRILAVSTFILVLLFWNWMRRLNLSHGSVSACNMLAAIMTLQVVLGITTLLLVIPVTIAAIHQAVAVIVFGAVVWVMREVRQKDPQYRLNKTQKKQGN